MQFEKDSWKSWGFSEAVGGTAFYIRPCLSEGHVQSHRSGTFSFSLHIKYCDCFCVLVQPKKEGPPGRRDPSSLRFPCRGASLMFPGTQVTWEFLWTCRLWLNSCGAGLSFRHTLKSSQRCECCRPQTTLRVTGLCCFCWVTHTLRHNPLCYVVVTDRYKSFILGKWS